MNSIQKIRIIKEDSPASVLPRLNQTLNTETKKEISELDKQNSVL